MDSNQTQLAGLALRIITIPTSTPDSVLAGEEELLEAARNFVQLNGLSSDLEFMGKLRATLKDGPEESDLRGGIVPTDPNLGFPLGAHGGYPDGGTPS